VGTVMVLVALSRFLNNLVQPSLQAGILDLQGFHTRAFSSIMSELLPKTHVLCKEVLPLPINPFAWQKIVPSKVPVPGINMFGSVGIEISAPLEV
jgi:hypothetical protein